MPKKAVYFKQNVLAEPLFNQWYAWSHLIAPANAAMYIANVHLKIMQSFIVAPQVHAAACKNPEMMGGPFINYSDNRVREVEELLQTTVKSQASKLAFAQAFQKIEKVLLEEANGSSLEDMYSKVPDELKGYIELVYDLNNQPAVRLIEGLLYKSHYYDSSAQSVALSLINEDERSFVLSTPRLKDESQLHLNIPFNDKRLDELFSMKYKPKSFDYIRDLLGVSDKDGRLFSSFFTEEEVKEARKYEGHDVRVSYYGHACILIEAPGVSVLIDPVISYKINSGIPRYTYANLPPSIDYALITHNHQDHCMLEALIQLRHRVKTLIVPRSNSGVMADPSLKLALQAIGFHDVKEIDEMETIEVQGGSITGVPFLGEHADLNIRAKIGYLITLQGSSLLAVADSNNLEPKLYDHLRRSFGDIDILFVGMECDGAPMSWVYGGLLTRPLVRKADQSRRLNGSNYEKASDIVKRLKPKLVYIYAMGQEPWLTHIVAIKYSGKSPPIIESNKLIAWCREQGIEAERLFGCKEIILSHHR